ncbi:MAG: hypothetical protein HQL50_08605 [Magnetococcales bacterium]|nr:hypothetical protein [Magnetococcales bacterium]
MSDTPPDTDDTPEPVKRRRPTRNTMEWLGYGAIMIGLASVLALAVGVGGFFLDWMAAGLLMLPLGIFFLGLYEAQKHRVRHPAAILGLALYFLVLSVWDFLEIALTFPFLVLSVIAGPMMVITVMVGSGLLVEYALRSAGVRFEGVSGFLHSGSDALIALVVVAVAVGILYVRRLDDDPVMEWGWRFSDWLYNTLDAFYRALLSRYGEQPDDPES